MLSCHIDMSDSASPRPPSSAGVAPSTPPVHTMSFADTGVSRWNSECAELAKNSYKCIADNNGKKEPCVGENDDYFICSVLDVFDFVFVVFVFLCLSIRSLQQIQGMPQERTHNNNRKQEERLVLLESRLAHPIIFITHLFACPVL